MQRIDEPVQVAINRDGMPIAFKWRSANYSITSRPTRWFSRQQWWANAERAHRGVGAGVLEVEMWRIQAGTMQAELLHTTQDNRWRILRLYS